MAKLIEYDNTGVEEGGGGTGVKARPGVHIARIARCTHRDTNKAGGPANDLEIALDVGEEYDWVFTYVGLDPASDWKRAEFTRALGMKEKGKFDPEKLVDQLLRIKINPGTWNGSYSPDAGRMMKALPTDKKPGRVDGASAADLGAEPSENGDGLEPQTDEEAQGGGPQAADDTPRYREGQPDPEDADVTVGSYDDWSDEDLEAEVTDRDLTLASGRASKKNKMINALRADDEEWAGSATTPEDSSEDADAIGSDDYDQWDLDQLKEEWEKRSLGDLPKFRGSGAEQRVMDAIVEKLREDDNENPFT